MTEFFIRTEDIRPESILEYFVETSQDRSIIDAIKATNPVIIVGSRGVGKSFLLRVAQAELEANFEAKRILPVYVTFSRSSLVHHASSPDRFKYWMLGRLCSQMLRALGRAGIRTSPSAARIQISGRKISADETLGAFEDVVAAFEGAWQHPTDQIDSSVIPTVDDFREAVEDICSAASLKRICFLIDEAAHIFLPEQQRQFFTLFRDLRSPYLSCNAAVYPGVTAYGDTFQPAHDATKMSLDRDILANDYIRNMREIVEKQADAGTAAVIARNGANFSILAYAASGNPRILLKTLSLSPKLRRQDVNEVVRQFYRTDIWSEHSVLAEKYAGHRAVIDWGRKFIEGEVLPELQKKNAQYLASEKKATCFFWVHRDAPAPVREALRLLAYTGIVVEHATGIRATRSEIGTRYAVNLGALFALEGVPTSIALDLARNLDPRRMSEYGSNHAAYQDLMDVTQILEEPNLSEVLTRQLEKSIDVLDITQWQRDTLRSIGLNKVGDVLRAKESDLQAARYVAEVRSRQMRNAALAALFEYLSG
ncbi:MAG: hypothetical protein QOC81_3730 [Thermoanaerobaculia bacterium]|jgi:hypothetical protein|nr:hypothetical protein [Thermoanaerobaculia bacterium]